MSDIDAEIERMKAQARSLREALRQKKKEKAQQEGPKEPRKMKAKLRVCDRCRLPFLATARRQVLHEQCAYEQRLELRRVREAQVHYRKHEKNRKGITNNTNRNRARWAVKNAIKAGLKALRDGKPLEAHHLIKPKHCSVCKEIPPPMNNGKSSIRADHYMGYSRENWLHIRWICARCDGKNETIKRQRSLGKLAPKPQTPTTPPSA